MSTLRTATGAVASRLAAAGCVAAAEEADELIAAAPDDESLEMWVRRREQGEPLPWILGTAWFGDRQLRIDPGVYVPRPQSEELARRAATLLPNCGRAVDCLALDGGGDGLDLVRRIVVAAARLLRPGGWLLIELGGEQDRGLSQTLAASGFDAATS